MTINYCFIVPILHGGLELIRKWKKENIVNNKKTRFGFISAGISRELVCIQHLPRDFVVTCYETDDPEESLKLLAAFSEPWVCQIPQTFE